MTVYIVDLENIPTRYTCEWKVFLPKALENYGCETCIIDGIDNLPVTPTPGMFLNFAATNIYKSSQVEKFSRLFLENKIKDGDYFLFTDAWHPGVIQLKYMAELLQIKIRIGGMWHAGSYDKNDGLGRLIGDVPWVRHAEKSMYHCYDDNFFATEFHLQLFEEELLEWRKLARMANSSNHIVGWPMEYLIDILQPYMNVPKKQKIIFPHRIAPEKQVEIFRDLAKELPQYEWFVAQDQPLTKAEYHRHLAESKLMFSANLQETLGITAYEAALVGTLPILPDRLSYPEMWNADIFYPSAWSENWESYQTHKDLLKNYINFLMQMDHTADTAKNAARETGQRFFSGTDLYEHIKSYSE